MSGLRVVLAEDDVLLREGLASLLERSGYALQRIARGGSVVDPALVQELVTSRRREDPLAALSDRERQVLDLMADAPTPASHGGSSSPRGPSRNR